DESASLLTQMKNLWLRHLRAHPHADGSDDAHERALIENIEDLGELTAEEVMVPRVDIVAVDVTADTDAFLSLIRATPHSRIPVYQDALDNILGFIHIKDVLRAMAGKEPIVLQDLLHPAMIVSPSMPALDLLVQMRHSRRHLALVVDEYGGIDGLVTMGDLVEAIVGELSDEHKNHKEPRLVEKPDGTVLVDARYSIDLFESKYGELFAENERNEADTLGGLAMFIAGRLPTRGELLTHSSGVQIEVLDADMRRLKRLRIRNLPSQRAATAAE